MTPRDLYEWALEHGVENCDIVMVVAGIVELLMQALMK